jgi:hypothetical protein
MVDCGFTFHLSYLHMSYIYFISFLSYFIYTKLYILTHWEVKALPFLKNRVSMFMFLEEPDDVHNMPKLVAQISK